MWTITTRRDDGNGPVYSRGRLISFGCCFNKLLLYLPYNWVERWTRKRRMVGHLQEISELT